MPNPQKATMEKMELIRAYLENKMSQHETSQKTAPDVSPFTPLP